MKSITQVIETLGDYLRERDYDVVMSDKETSIVKHSDDPWNELNAFIAKPDGIYNHVEVCMGGYELKKRVNCRDLDTATLLMLSRFFALTVNCREIGAEETAIIDDLRRFQTQIVTECKDEWRGRCLIEEYVAFLERSAM